MSGTDETRATLRRLVETQAAALREVTAQRDALLRAAEPMPDAVEAYVQPEYWDGTISKLTQALREAVAAAKQ